MNIRESKAKGVSVNLRKRRMSSKPDVLGFVFKSSQYHFIANTNRYTKDILTRKLDLNKND